MTVNAAHWGKHIVRTFTDDTRVIHAILAAVTVADIVAPCRLYADAVITD